MEVKKSDIKKKIQRLELEISDLKASSNFTMSKHERVDELEYEIKVLKTMLKESKLNELRFQDIINQQKDVVKLFPTFYDRVKKVQANGGAKPVKFDRDRWTFRVPSGDPKRHAEGIVYTVVVQFEGVRSVIEQAAENPANWTKDGKHLNLNQLGRIVLYNAQILLSSNSPADQFWGPNYKRTKMGAQGEPEENRPANIRNPNNYGIASKHIEAILEVLPFFAGTMASELKKWHREDIQQIEKQAIHNNFHPEDRPEEVAQAETPEEEQGEEVDVKTQGKVLRPKEPVQKEEEPFEDENEELRQKQEIARQQLQKKNLRK